MPYRVDLRAFGDDMVDRLIDLGALDIEPSADGTIAALLPDSVTTQEVATALGIDRVVPSPAIGRDDGSVWILSQRPISVGRLRIVPATHDGSPDTVRLIDAPAFGTGLHPTTALCLEILEAIVDGEPPESVLDVGTGSGILALAALRLGVPQALAIDNDVAALRVAAENAALNGLTSRVTLAAGGPETVTGRWPLVLANILAAPLIEMASTLSRRVGHRGRLVLSGIPSSVEPDVHRAYRHLGMRRVDVLTRDSWVAVVFQASW